MVDYKQKISAGFLLITLILSGIVYISLDNSNVKIRIDGDKTTIYTLDNGYWKVSGKEYNNLFDGSSKMYRSLSSINVVTEINYTTNITIVTRQTKYIRGPVIRDIYTFNGSLIDVENFPLSHIVEVINGSGYFYRYEVRDLTYNGSKTKLNSSSMNFGLNMKVEWQDNYRWAWIYGNGVLKVQYDIESDYEVFHVRLFDPPKADQMILNSLTKDMIFTNLKENNGKDRTSLFTLNNPFNDVSMDNIQLLFNEVCGNIVSYDIYKEDIVVKNLNGTQKNVIEKNYNISKGPQDYKIEAVINKEICPDGTYGYQIDWIPKFNYLNKSFIQIDWAWWNETANISQENERINFWDELDNGSSTTNARPIHYLENNLLEQFSMENNANGELGRYDGTNNGATYTANGKVGGAYNFDGVNDYISIGTNPKPVNISVGAWIYINDLSGASYQFIINKRQNAGGYSSVSLLLWESSDTVRFYIGNAGTEDYIESTSALKNNTWYYVVGTYNGTTMNLYVDGTLNSTGTARSGDIAYSDAYNWMIASDSGGTGYLFNGTIDELGIYDRDLSASEISNIYNSGIGRRYDKVNVQLDYPFSNNLLMFLKFSNNTIDETYQNSGVNNGATYTASGKIGGAYSFDGVNDYINMNILVNDLISNTQGSIECWHKPDNIPSTGVIFSFGDAGVSTSRIRLDISNTDNKIHFRLWDGSLLIDIASDANASVGDWQHIVINQDGTNVTMYINGSAQSNTSGMEWFNNLTTPDTSRIGARSFALDSFYNGTIDECRVFNRSLSASEVSYLYNGGSGRVFNESANMFYGRKQNINNFLVKESLLLYYLFDQDILDYSGNNYDGTNNGATYIASGKIGGAYSFDGANDNIKTKTSTTNTVATYNVWLKTSQTTQDVIIGNRNIGGSGDDIMTLYINQGGIDGRLQIYLYDRDNAKQHVEYVDIADINNGSWHMITLTYDISGATDIVNIYYDGVNQSTTISSAQGLTALDELNSNYLASNGDIDSYLNCTLDEFMIFNRSLSASEISEIYNSGNHKRFSTNNTINYVKPIINTTKNNGEAYFKFSDDFGLTYTNWLTDANNSELFSISNAQWFNFEINLSGNETNSAKVFNLGLLTYFLKIENVRCSPTSPRTTDTLECFCNASSDGDNVSYSYISYLNGIENSSTTSHDLGDIIENISLNSSHTSGRGIAVNGTFFWVTSLSDTEIYKYYMNGTYTGDSIDTSGQGFLPEGLMINGSILYTSDFGGNNVLRKYDVNGTYLGTISLPSENDYPLDYTNNGTEMWIGDVDGTVYHYYLNGTIIDNFTLEFGDVPEGITYLDGFLWVQASNEFITRKYSLDGNFNNSNFTTSFSIEGLDAYDNEFWTNDGNKKVRRHYADQSVFYTQGTEISLINITGLTSADNWTFSCQVRNTDDVYTGWTNSSLYTVNRPPTTLSSRCEPTSPLSSDNLTCYCNGTDPDGDNVSYYIEYFNKDVSIFSGLGTRKCYQESMNVSNQTGIDGNCGLNYTGTHDSGLASYSLGQTYVHNITYVKPEYATSATWQVKPTTTVNVSILNSCFDYDSTFLYLRFDISQYVSAVYCYNGSYVQLYTETSNGNYGGYNTINKATALEKWNDGNWGTRALWEIFNRIYFQNTLGRNQFYEEAIYWDVTLFTEGEEHEVYTINSSTTTFEDDIVFSCLISDLEFNGTAINSSTYIVRNDTDITYYNTTPDSPYTVNDLKFNITCESPVYSTITSHVQLYNGSELFGSQINQTVTNNTNTLIYTLGSGNTTKTETWTGEYWCEVSTQNSTKYNESVTILNSIPTAPTSLSATNPVLVGENITVTATGYTDDDNDSLTVYYEFYNIDDTTTIQAYSTTNFYTTVGTDNNNVIRIRVKVGDGTSNSSEAELNITVSELIILLAGQRDNISVELESSVNLTTNSNNTVVCIDVDHSEGGINVSCGINITTYFLNISYMEKFTDSNDNTAINITFPNWNVQENYSSLGRNNISTWKDINWTFAFDNDWNTYLIINITNSYSAYFINYTKPSYASSAMWEVAFTSTRTNITIPDDCWLFDDENLMLAVQIGDDGIDEEIFFRCRNADIDYDPESFGGSDGWKLIGGGGSNGDFKEEQIHWDYAILEINSHQYDEVINLTLNLSGHISNGYFPFVKLYVNNSLSNYIGELTNSTNRTISEFTDTSTNIERDYSIGEAYSMGNFELPSDATILTTALNISGTTYVEKTINNEFCNGDSSVHIDNNDWIAQSFTSQSTIISGVSFNVESIDAGTDATDYLRVTIRQTFNGANLSELNLSSSNITQYSYPVYDIPETNLSEENTYYIILSCPTCDATLEGYTICVTKLNPYSGGKYYKTSNSGSTWSSKGSSWPYFYADLYDVGFSTYINSTPTDVKVEIGTIDGTYEFNQSGSFSTTSGLSNFTAATQSYIDACTEDSNGFCSVPIIVYSTTPGTINISNISVLYNRTNINPIQINKTLISSYLNNSINDTTIPIYVYSSQSGILEVSDIKYIYAGGNDSVKITAHNTGYSINITYNITYYYSDWNYNLPPNVLGIDWFGSYPTQKNVTPFGQTSSVPILNVTHTNYGGNMNLSVLINATEPSSCVNITFSNTSSKSDGQLMTNDTFYLIESNKSYLSNTQIWLWADFQCSYNDWRIWQPTIYLLPCYLNADVCDEDLS